MKDDFDNFDEEIENLPEEISEQPETNYIEENNDSMINNPNASEQVNTPKQFNPMGELAKSTAITGVTASKANAYNKFTQTNLGKSLMMKGSSPLSGLQNNNLNKFSANKINRMLNPMKGLPSPFNKSMSNVNGISNNNGVPESDLPKPNSALNNPLTNNSLSNGDSQGGLNKLLKGNQSGNIASLFGKKSTGGSFLGKKKLLILKLKLIGAFLAFFGIVFIFLLIWYVIDGDEQNFLELTNWNINTNTNSNENVSSDTNFSNDDKEVLSVSLSDKIGEDGINELITKINNAGNNKCDGANVAKKLVALIDEVGKKGYKIPYSNYSNGYKVIDPDWGKNVDGNIIGLNEFGLIDWAINSANINNTFTNINEFNNRSDMIDLEYGNPGDLIINGDKAYIILQNTGDNVTVAFIDNNGASYKKYTYNDLTSYSIVDMSSYYSANCKN